MGVHALAKLIQPTLGSDVVTVKNRSRLVAADLHRFLLAKASLDHVRQGSTAEVVE